MKSVKRCGKCQQVGHNRRTCGTVNKKTVTPIHPPTTTPVLTRQSFEMDKTSPSDVDTAYTLLNGSGTDVATVNIDTGMYSAEELETLWALYNGRSGKRVKGHNDGGNLSDWEDEDTNSLYEFVDETEKSAGASSETWGKFFKTLGAEAKILFLMKYRKSLPLQPIRSEYGFVGTALQQINKIEGKVMHADESKKVLSEKFFQALAADTSKQVHEQLASLVGMPKSVAIGLVQKANIPTLLKIVGNNTSTSEVLAEVESRLQVLETNLQERYDNDNLQYNSFKSQLDQIMWVRGGIAKHPETTTETLMLYLTSLEMMKDERIYKNIYDRENIPREAQLEHWKVVNERFNKVETELRECLKHNSRITLTKSEATLLREGPKELSNLKSMRTDMVTSGFAPTNESVQLVLNEMEQYEKSSLSLRGSTSRRDNLTYTIANANFTQQQLYTYHNHFLEEEDIQIACLMNKNATPHIAKKTLQWLADNKKKHDAYISATLQRWAQMKEGKQGITPLTTPPKSIV